MARLKQTKRQNAEQARASSTPAPPPTTPANEKPANATDENVPIISKVSVVLPDSTAILEPQELVVAIANSEVAQPTTPAPPAKRRSRKRKDGRLPYLAAHELKGFVRYMERHFNQRGPPKQLYYCLDCLRTHMIIWCDGTREEVEKTCAFHEKKYVNLTSS